MGPMSGQTGTTLCSLPAPVDMAASRARAVVAHWLDGSVVGLAEARRPGPLLTVRLLE